jgi:hypothetical protein
MNLSKDTLGSAYIIAPSGRKTLLKVTRRDHHKDMPPGITLPGSARWAFVDTVDAVWVECDVWCCYIDPIRSA